MNDKATYVPDQTGYRNDATNTSLVNAAVDVSNRQSLPSNKDLIDAAKAFLISEFKKYTDNGGEVTPG